MEQTELDIGEIRAALDEIRAGLRGLSARVAKLEEDAKLKKAAKLEKDGAPPEVVPAEPVAQPPAPETLSDEIVATIAACVAAFFGERVHIRQIRLVGSPAWAQQGRVSIQASHQLH